MMEVMHICRKCKRPKYSEEYYRCSKRSSGLRTQCKECGRLRDKEYYARPGVRTKKLIKAALYNIENPGKNNSRIAIYKKENPAYASEQYAKRHASLTKQTPLWGNRFFIKEAYELAVLRNKAFKFKWEVDHIIPLKCKTASGLHVENNLAVIPAILNNRKQADLVVITPY